MNQFSWTMEPVIAPVGTTVTTTVVLPDGLPAQAQIYLDVYDLNGAHPGYPVATLKLKAGVSQYTVDEGDANQFLIFKASPATQQEAWFASASAGTVETRRVVRDIGIVEPLSPGTVPPVVAPPAPPPVAPPVQSGHITRQTLSAVSSAIHTPNFDVHMKPGDEVQIDIIDGPFLPKCPDFPYPGLSVMWGSRDVQGVRDISISTIPGDFNPTTAQVIVDSDGPLGVFAPNGDAHFWFVADESVEVPRMDYPYFKVVPNDKGRWTINFKARGTLPLDSPAQDGTLFYSVG
jgi:hypothetical protein